MPKLPLNDPKCYIILFPNLKGRQREYLEQCEASEQIFTISITLNANRAKKYETLKDANHDLLKISHIKNKAISPPIISSLKKELSFLLNQSK